MSDNLKQKMIGAVAWTTIDRFGQQASQFLVGLMLARLLSPADYGLLGMIMIFTTLSYVLVESGFTQALVRKQDATEIDYNSVFYFNIFTSIILYFILYFIAPYIAVFFKQPQLTLLSRVIFLAVFFNSMYLVPFTKLVKKMDLKTTTKISITSTVLSGICGLVLAFLHYGVWALVFQQVLYQFFRMIGSYYFEKWKPQLIFSFSVIREFGRFTINLLGTAILNILFNNLYIMLLSRFYPIKQVGFYTQSNKLSETFNFSFNAIITGSTYLIFTKIQDDNERFRRIYREIARKASIISFPIMLVLIAMASSFIYVLLSAKWMPAVPYFQLLCLASLFTPLYGLSISALNSRGYSKITFRIEIIKKVLTLLSVVICFQYGIIAMLWGYVFSCFISYLVSVLYLKSNIEHFVKHQINDFLGCLAVGLIIALCVFGISFLISNFYLLFALQILLAITLYIICIKLFYNDLYNSVLNFIIGRFPFLRFIKSK